METGDRRVSTKIEFTTKETILAIVFVIATVATLALIQLAIFF